MHPTARHASAAAPAAILALAAIAIAQEAPAQNQPADANAVAWLRANAIPMRTLELDAAPHDDPAKPGDTDAPDDADAPGDANTNNPWADLAPLAEHIGDARVVLLGEQTHGDGAAFLAKTRLIAYLHEQLGFDVLCFESGFYACAVAQRRIAAGEPARAAIDDAVFPIWTRSQQFAPLVDYVQQRAQTERPLLVAGYDCQVTGASGRAIVGPAAEAIARATRALSTPDRPALPPPALADWIRAIGAVSAGAQGTPTEADARALDELAAYFDRAHAAQPDDDDAAHFSHGFWAQVARSLAGQARSAVATATPGPTPADDFNPRDEQGARNMAYLVNERYKGRKIVVWLASMHALRDHGAIDNGGLIDYTGLRSMGEVLTDEHLGEDDVYVIACTTHGGQAGLPWRQPWPVPPAAPGSFEALCHAAGLENAIVPLRGANGDEFPNGEYAARPLGNAPMRAVWPRHADAFLFQRTMTPSTQR